MIQTLNYYCTYKFGNLLKLVFIVTNGFGCLLAFYGPYLTLKSYNQKYVIILPLLHFDFKPMSGTVLSVTDELQPVATRTKEP